VGSAAAVAIDVPSGQTIGDLTMYVCYGTAMDERRELVKMVVAVTKKILA
jgi:hypothetical protein